MDTFISILYRFQFECYFWFGTLSSLSCSIPISFSVKILSWGLRLMQVAYIQYVDGSRNWVWQSDVSRIWVWQSDVSRIWVWQSDVSRIWVWQSDVSRIWVWQPDVSRIWVWQSNPRQPTNLRSWHFPFAACSRISALILRLMWVKRFGTQTTCFDSRKCTVCIQVECLTWLNLVLVIFKFLNALLLIGDSSIN